MSKYLKIVEKANKTNEDTAAQASPPNEDIPPATKATEATKAPTLRVVREETRRDKSDRSDKRVSFTPLTVSEALREINRFGSGAGKNAELYRNGELSEEGAVEYVTCAILQRRGESFEVWKHHAAVVRKALHYCIHELPPDDCKVCNGYVKRLIEEGSA